MSTYLGIDLGTTATKAVIIEPDGTVVARSRVLHADARAIGPGRVDPGAWMKSVEAACAQLGPVIAKVSAVGLSAHSPTALLYDRDGTPLASGLTWDHPDLPDVVAGLAGSRDGEEAELAGNRVSPATFMIAAYPFFAENERDALASAVELGFVGSWLGRWITGESALDPTQASYTGAFTSTGGRLRWLSAFLERAGIPQERLPRLQGSLTTLGTVHTAAAKRLGVPAGIPVIVGSADTPAASFALGAAPSGIPLLLMGTTHVVSNCLDAPDNRALALQRSDVRESRWLINGVTNGGDALAAGARLLGLGTGAASVKALVAAASRATPSEAATAPVFIPHVMPERGPLWLTEPCTALVGFDAHTSSAAAARGVLEGVLFVDRMVVDSCVHADQGELYLSGAFGDDTAMSQMIADALGREVRVVDESNLSAVGAAGMASEVVEGRRIGLPGSRAIVPRDQWREVIDKRWTQFVPIWERTVGRPALEPLAPADA